MSRRLRAVVPVLVALSLLLVAGWFTSPASAHSDLVSSTLADGTWTPDEGPAQLMFSTALLPSATRVVAAEGDAVRRLPADTFDNRVQVDLAGLPAGPVRLRFAVVGVDGHRITDEISFRAAGPAAPGSAAFTAAPDATAEKSSPEPRLVVGGMLVFLLVAVALSTANALVSARGRT